MKNINEYLPDLVMLSYEGGECKKTPTDGKIVEKDIQIFIYPSEEMHIEVTADQTPVRFIKLRWKTIIPSGVRIFGDAWERTYGDIGWTGMVPYRAMPWYFLVKEENQVSGFGVKVRPSAMCFWQADPAGITLWMDLRCGGEGVILQGRTITAAYIVSCVYPGSNTFEAARSFCSKMCTDPIFPTEPVYGSNNWYYAYGHSSEEEILIDTDYLVSMTKGLKNKPYMVVDDGWQKNRTDEYIGGPWNISNEAFPDMERLATLIKEKGAKPGIWFRPLLDRETPVSDEARLSADILDPSHPDVLKKVAADVDTLCRWGYKLIKHDFSTFDSLGKWGFQMQPFVTEDGWHFYDRSKTSAEILINFYKTILEAALPYHALILGCDVIGHLAAGLEHIHRTGDDTSGIMWERTLRMGVNTLAMRMPQHKTFFDRDADCIGIMGSIPWEFNKQWGKLLSESGTAFFVSVKPNILSEEQKAELSTFLEKSSKVQSIARPLDWEETLYPQDWQKDQDVFHYDWYQDTGILVARDRKDVWSGLNEGDLFYSLK